MVLYFTLTLSLFSLLVCEAYKNNLFTITKSEDGSNQDPFDTYQQYLHKIVYGENVEKDDGADNNESVKRLDKNDTKNLRFYVMGNFMQSELFNNKSGVHLPPLEFIQRELCELKITRDFMQTAVNAFAIFLYGSLADIERLPANYVLRSARSISMMKIAREKLVATWNVVRGSQPTNTITIQTLEMYRPLFKYINGREIARLNLSDDRILSYIGTHDGLDRHQVFYHIRACDPLQRRFYLAMMTRTQALGKSYSWNARDVSRLGLLLAEVDGRDLSYINPKAMSGINAQVLVPFIFG
ncbi:unnamed protein product, partial [Brenthis ino]